MMFKTTSALSSASVADASRTKDYWRVYRETWPVAWGATESTFADPSVHRRYEAAHELAHKIAVSFCDVASRVAV